MGFNSAFNGLMLSQVTGENATVVPIYKGGDRTVVGNYRPVRKS